MPILEWPGETSGDIVLKVDRVAVPQIVGVLVLLAIPIGLALSPLKADLAKYMGLIFGACALVSLAIAAQPIFAAIRRRRVVISDDCLYLYQYDSKILGQVPFDNISHMNGISDYMMDMHVVHIDLYDPNDPDTFWPDDPDLGDEDEEYILIGIDRPAKFIGAINRRR